MTMQPDKKPPVFVRIMMGLAALCALVAAIFSFNQSSAALIPGGIAMVFMLVGAISNSVHNGRTSRAVDEDQAQQD